MTRTYRSLRNAVLGAILPQAATQEVAPECVYGRHTEARHGRTMKSLGATVVLATSLAGSGFAFAASETSPADGRALVQAFGKQIVEAYKSNADSNVQRRMSVGQAMLEKMDFATVSNTVLRECVEHANTYERREFSRLFTAFFIEEILEQFNTVPVTDFAIDEIDTLADGDVVVDSEVFFADGDSFSAGWRVRSLDGKPRIVDVLFMGFSVVNHFSGKLERRSRGSIRRLNKYLLHKVSGSQILALVH